MRHLTFILVIAGFALLSGCAGNFNKLTSEEIEQGWELLFDGKNLEHWRLYNGEGTGSWGVDDNCLTADGTGSDSTGYIISKKEYANFDLKFDWKIAPEGNSGVIYHVVESDRFRTPYVTGPEYQLIDDTGWPGELAEWQKTGADYAMYLPDTTKKVLREPGQWNSSRILFDNGHAEYWLNGEKITEFEAWTPEWFTLKNSGKWAGAPEYGLATTGHLSLQDHGSRVWFRNMKIRELPAREHGPVTLFNGSDLTGWTQYGTEKWYVEDSLLVCESGPDKGYGYLATDMYYKDFDLSVDFRQISDGNSGIFFRSMIDGTRISGWQVEVAPEGHDTGGIYESYGRGWLVQIPDEMERILKPGDWNRMRIKVVGAEVTVWLNDTEMTRLNDPEIGKANGRIALQIHDGGGIKVQWKNLVVQHL